MGKRNVLVEGLSGSGKTTVATELQHRGHDVVHGDRQLKYRGDPASGEPVPLPAAFRDPQSRAAWIHRHLCWSPAQVAHLAARTEAELTFFCGGSRNTHQFLDLFDAVFVLEVDVDVLSRRLDQRPGDEWAGRGRTAEREQVLHLHRTKEDLPDGIVIDAARPVAAVVDDILRHCEELAD